MKLDEIKNGLKSFTDSLPKDFSADKLLASLGLEQRRSRLSMILPGIAMFGAGIIVGAALGAIFAPKAGIELRADLAEKLESLTHSFMKDKGKESTNATA
jgi:hypothetical protein